MITYIIPLFLFIGDILYGSALQDDIHFIPIIVAAVIFYEGRAVTLNLLYLGIIMGVKMSFLSYSYEPFLDSNAHLSEKSINFIFSIFLTLWWFLRFVIGMRNQEQLLAAKNKRLEELNKENDFKTTLIGMLAHDLRSPIGAFERISTKFNQLLKKEEYQKLDTLGNYFERSSKELFENLDVLLNWVVLQNQSNQLSPSEFNLNEMVEGIIREFESKMNNKHIEINKNFENDVLLNTDSNILKVIVRNLLDNAIKYSPVNSTISIESLKSGGNYLFKIRDSGRGIKKDIVTALQSSKKLSASITEDSHSVGLQLCFYFAKILNLELDFENLENHGLEVTIVIPASQSASLIKEPIKQSNALIDT